MLLILAAMPMVAASEAPTILARIELAPFARAALLHQPADPTIGEPIPIKPGVNKSIAFFTPTCNCYEASASEAGSEFELGLKAAFPINFTVETAGEYLLGVAMRHGCYQWVPSFYTIWHTRLDWAGHITRPSENVCYGSCDQCKRERMGCSSMQSFFLCTEDPRSEAVNPAPSMSLASCSIITKDEPWATLKTFAAGTNTVFLAARQACSVGLDLMVAGPPFPTDARTIRPLFKSRSKFWPEDIAYAFGATLFALAIFAFSFRSLERRRRRRETRKLRLRLASSSPSVGDDGATATSSVVHGRVTSSSGSDLRSIEVPSSGHALHYRTLAVNLRVRVSAILLAMAALLIFLAVFRCARGLDTQPGDQNVLGPYPFWLSLVAVGAMLMLLGVLPTDRRAIRWITFLMVGLQLTVLGFCIQQLVTLTGELDHLIGGAMHNYGRAADAPMSQRRVFLRMRATIGILSAFVLVVSLQLIPLLMNLGPRVTPRAALLNMWRVLRIAYASFGVLAIVYQLILLFQPDGITPSDEYAGVPYMWTVSFFTLGAVLLVCATLASKRNRGWFYRQLARLSGRSGMEKMQQAAVIAALLGETFPDLALLDARSSFLAIPFDHLESTYFSRATTVTRLAHVRGQPHDKGQPHSKSQPHDKENEGEPAPSKAVPCELGLCDAFISHAHIDETLHPGEKFRALQFWAEGFPSPPMLWLDGVCLSSRALNKALPLLPIFVAGCKRFIVLAGSAYSSRLWTAMELFTFVHTGGKQEQIVVLPIGGVDVATLLSTFDASKASCTYPGDYDELIGIVESSFGDLQGFNAMVRTLVPLRSQAALPA
jgi:hypothetical protein